MINIYLSDVMMEDDSQKAEKDCLIDIMLRSRKIKNQQQLAKLDRRSGLNQANFCEKVIWCQEISQM